MSNSFLSEYESVTPPYGFIPVQGKADTFLINTEVEIGPDYCFSEGHDMTKHQRKLALTAIFARDGLVCKIGKHPLHSFYGINIHHELRGDVHVFKYLSFACDTHNSAHGMPAPSTVIVRENVGVGSAFTSKEGNKHDWQRPAWDEAIAKPETWINLGKKVGKNDAKIGDFLRLSALIDYLSGELVDPEFGKGSSVTYRRYANEDRFSKLEIMQDKGRLYVRYRTEGQNA